MKRAPSRYNGVVVVDKPSGITSHDVVNRLRRTFGTRRVGHAGTLDPLATGVLVVCLGQATRIVEFLSATRKRYTAGVLFGVRTDSQDITGQELTRQDASGLTQRDLVQVLCRFRGPISQIPPMHSALHHDGKRLYELARQGMEVERAARPVDIFRLDLVDFTPGTRAHALLDVECSSGTYIRTLAADIGDALGVGAVMDSLRRTKVGPFDLSRAYSLEALEELKTDATLSDSVIGIADALPDWSRVNLTDDEAAAVRMGRRLEAPADHGQGPTLLLDRDGNVVALATADSHAIVPFKVFGTEDR